MPARATGWQVPFCGVMPGWPRQIFTPRYPGSFRFRVIFFTLRLNILGLLNGLCERQQLFLIGLVIELDGIIIELKSPTFRHRCPLGVALTQIPPVRITSYLQRPDDCPLFGVVVLQSRHSRSGAAWPRTLSDESHAQYSSLCGLHY